LRLSYVRFERFQFNSKLELNWSSSTCFTSVSLNYVGDDLSIDLFKYLT
jgi:hypothetical protein